ncbi:hypothetical protein WI75_25640 [Burkholderia ubonensis]|nr:hypothetical protein WI75_25640 [Burkholderia ubonensis]
MRVMGDIAYDIQTRVLVNLADQSLKYLSRNESLLLQLLIEGPQTKEVLIEHIWGARGLVVTDASYYQLVTRLRRSFEAIGLSRDRLQTIPRYGLGLVPEATEAVPSGLAQSRETDDKGRPREPEVVVEPRKSGMASAETDQSLDEVLSSELDHGRPVRESRARFLHRISTRFVLVAMLVVGTCVSWSAWHTVSVTSSGATQSREANE